MKTTRGTIGYWACMLIGIGLLTLQGVKYYNDTLHLGFAELGLTIVAVVLIFAPKVLSEAFGKLLDKRLGSGSQAKSSSIGGGGQKHDDDNG